MTRQILTAISLFMAMPSFCQTDHHNAPIFHSETTGTDTIKDFYLISNYYPLKNNIDSKTTSVYISDKPTLDEILRGATNLPSNWFIIVKEHSILNLISVISYPKRKILVINPETGQQNEYALSLKGDITENRANEIIKEKYDPQSVILNDELILSDRKLKIIPNAEIKQAVLNLISKEKLSSADSSNVKFISQEELKSKILTETKEGGKLDFFTPIKGKEYDGRQIKPGLIETNIGIALYQWGAACFDMGVNTLEDALSIFSALKGRPLNIREKSYIKLGFEKGLEK